MSQPASTTKPFCIVADDVKAHRTLLSMWFDELDYDCQTAADGVEAWKLAVENPAKLIVTDIDMPVCSGLALLHSLRNHTSRRLQRVPVIVMSSMRDSKIRSFVDAYGGTVFLPKPLEKKTFLRVVSGIDDLKSGYVEPGTVPPPADLGGVQQISPTLRRLVLDVQRNGGRLV